MRKYLVRAEVMELEFDFETRLYTGIHSKYYTSREVIAEDADDACYVFKDIVNSDSEYDLEFDDFTWEDLGPGDVFIDVDFTDNSRCDYEVDAVPTMTVGELITYLSKFEKDARVYLRNDKELWNVFRGIKECDIEEPEILV